MKKLLIIFVKNPEPGKVKTRLAKKLGDEAALAIYLKLLDHTAGVVQNLSCDKVIYYSNYVDSDDRWDNRKYKKHLQKGSDLGERMAHAIEISFAAGYDSVCLIGTDNYEISPNVLETAFIKLESHDLVIGPAKDGGYYLIGMKMPFTKIFDLKHWSTPDVFSETIKIAEREGITYALTTLLNDIDVPEDLKGTGLYLFQR